VAEISSPLREDDVKPISILKFSMVEILQPSCTRMKRLFWSLGQSVVVKSLLFSLLKLVMMVMVLMMVFCWGSPAIASFFRTVTPQEFATKPPDDLQSFVIQAADSLDLPMFPSNDSDPDAQAKAQDNDSLEAEISITPPRANAQRSKNPSLELNAGSKATQP
jgi:hypothetical protein